jgi:hypothetical protein
VFADSVYAGEKVANATWRRRCVVERFLAWINRKPRLAKDFEATIISATAFLYACC